MDYQELQSKASSKLSSPKTILGFLGAMIAMLFFALVLLTRFLAQHETLEKYIPGLLIFGAVIFVFVLLSVLVICILKPEKLMLGEIKGEVYLEMLKLQQGDSYAGDVIDSVRIWNSSRRSALPVKKEREGQ